MTWHQNMGHKGPVLRPRCTGTERARTQLLYSILHCAAFLADPSFSVGRGTVPPVGPYTSADNMALPSGPVIPTPRCKTPEYQILYHQLCVNFNLNEFLFPIMKQQCIFCEV